MFSLSGQLKLFCNYDGSNEYEPYGFLTMDFGSNITGISFWNVTKETNSLSVPINTEYTVPLAYSFIESTAFSETGWITLHGMAIEGDILTVDDSIGDYDGQLFKVISIMEKELTKRFYGDSGSYVDISLKMK